MTPTELFLDETEHPCIVGAQAFYNKPLLTLCAYLMRHAPSKKHGSGLPKPVSASLTAAQKVAKHSAQEVRIIGGQWKRTPLAVPTAAGLRPTPSRVRETLFNWLGQDLTGWRVLDAFAGSGALGLEAASRGAESVTLVERESVLAHAIRANVAKLKAEATVKVQQGDALSLMQQSQRLGQLFDLIFLDPPFESDLFDLALAAARTCVPDGGWIYLEAPRAFEAGEDSGLRLARQGKAGAVHFHLFQRVDA